MGSWNFTVACPVSRYPPELRSSALKYLSLASLTTSKLFESVARFSVNTASMAMQQGPPQPPDYDALKDQWSEVEDRDGIRLSWNCIPSTRMVWLL